MNGWVREILRCPVCRGQLTDAPAALVCQACQLRFPIVEGIPVLLESDAEAVGS